MDGLPRLFLRKIINCRGPVTVLGAGRVKLPVSQLMLEVLDRAVDMGELQARAGDVISAFTGAEAGCVTGCAAAGISIGVAATLTGDNLGKISMLPKTVDGPDGIVVQKGQLVSGGGCSIAQLIQLPGARLIEVGESADCAHFHVEAALNDGVAGALFVLGGRANGPGTLPLGRFVSICHERGVPVIVDAAATTNLEAVVSKGADLIVASAHKWYGGPTAGLIAGREDLVRACYLNGEFGIGRPMKAGKEGVVGLIAALQNWNTTGQTRRQSERVAIEHLASLLEGLEGLDVQIIAPSEDSPSACTLRIKVDPDVAALPAWEIGRRLFWGDPTVALNAYDASMGYLFVDPGLLDEGDERIIADRMKAVLTEASREKPSFANAEPPTRFEVLTDHMRTWRERPPRPGA